MQTQTKERGITLIALIVTLIILIILAAITISMIYKTKIIEYAINGSKDYSKEAIRENEILDKTANLLDSAVESIKDMNKHEGEEKPPEEEIDNTITEADIGKYIAYEMPKTDNSFNAKAEYSGYDTDQEYTGTEGLKWRILSKEGNKIELVADRGDNNTFYLKGYQGYNNGVALLNNACNHMYVNKELGAVSARSLKIEDIQKHYTGAEPTLEESTPSSKYYPEIFAQEQYGSINGEYIGDLGISEMPNSGLNGEGYIMQGEKKQAGILRAKRTQYAFTMTGENMNKDGGDGSLYTSLFSHIGSSNAYQWLASRCVWANTDTYMVQFRMFCIYNSLVYADDLYYSNDNMYSYGYAVRPVVTIDLKTVKLEGEGTTENPYTIMKR